MRIVYSLVFEAEVGAEDAEILQANEGTFKEAFAADVHFAKTEIEDKGFKFLSYNADFVKGGDASD